MQIGLWTGNGQPGPLDPSSRDPGAEAIEAGVFQLNQLFHGHLVDEGIPSAYHYYGAGTHIWPYWARDLREYVGPLMRRFAHPPRRSAASSAIARWPNPWRQWGWRVALERPEPAFSSLSASEPARVRPHRDGRRDGHHAAALRVRREGPGHRERAGAGRTSAADAARTAACACRCPLSGGPIPATAKVTIRR